MIDSDVWIEYEKGRFPLGEYLESRSGENVAMSVVSASELLHGWHRSPSGTVRERRRAFIEGIFRGVALLPFDLPAARVHAALWADLRTRGRSIGAHDLMIAATALSLDYEVVTFNARDFRAVPGLRIGVPAA